MQVVLALPWWLSPLVFIVLAAGLGVHVAIAGLAAVLLPAAKIELWLSWKTVLLAALIVGIAKKAADDQFACIIAKFFTDLVSSRSGSAAYRWLGGVIHFVDEAAPLAAMPGRPESHHTVNVIRTKKGSSERLTVLAPLFLASGAPPSGEPAVVVDAGTRFQSVLGFGGSFTESSAELFQQMSQEKQEQLLSAYFDEQTGLGFNLGRLHIGSCDFSRGNWSCVEEAGDADLKSFNIKRYDRAILPMIRRAQQKARKTLLLMASPWSPPQWMKDTGSMLDGGRLLPEWRAAWARHYVLFAESFKAAGVPLWALTVQNEPQAKTPWENCLYTHEEERDFVRDHLGPALEASGLDVKLFIWDHNRDDLFARASTILKDMVAEKYVWGIAYHWYGDPRHEMWPAREGQVVFDNLRHVHELGPSKHIVMTEACQEFGPRLGSWRVAERYGEAMIRDFNNHLEAWIDWNLVLDTHGGPNHVKNYVTAPVIFDFVRDKVLLQSIFFYIGHFSRFVRPGARRVLASSSRDGLEVVAFMNPDDTLAIVVMNRGDYDIRFWLHRAAPTCSTCGGSASGTRAEAPAHSITTFLMMSGSSGDDLVSPGDASLSKDEAS